VDLTAVPPMLLWPLYWFKELSYDPQVHQIYQMAKLYTTLI